MPYLKEDYKQSNVDYLNKDFSSLKNALIEYAKAYFPNSYRDFNETSPGMMLIEMAAYVGDVNSFYIDQQYKEMMLPLAQERKNVVNLANMLGYKTKAINPSYTTLVVTQKVDATGDELRVPDYSSLALDRIEPKTQIQSTADSTVLFETLDFVDFTYSGSANGVFEEPEASDFDSSTGIATKFEIKRTIRAISGETKTKNFNVGTPQKFLKLTIPETDVVEVIKIEDSNGNEWYEVDYLAQDKIPIETFHSTDTNRQSAYSLTGEEIGDTTYDNIPVPYSLQFIKSSKKFTTMVNQDNTTSLLFGNGIMRTGQIVGEQYLQTEQAGMTIPGEETEFPSQLDPLSGDNEATLGESPANTQLIVTYRKGGGLAANVGSGDLTTFVDSTIGASCNVTNELPAQGGSSGDTVEEIRHRALSNFTSQTRCVTGHDYEARTLAMPARFGGIAKVLVRRAGTYLTSVMENITAQGISSYTPEAILINDQTFTPGDSNINIDFSENINVHSTPVINIESIMDTASYQAVLGDPELGADSKGLIGIMMDYIMYPETSLEEAIYQNILPELLNAMMPTCTFNVDAFEAAGNILQLEDEAAYNALCSQYITSDVYDAEDEWNCQNYQEGNAELGNAFNPCIYTAGTEPGGIDVSDIVDTNSKIINLFEVTAAQTATVDNIITDNNVVTYTPSYYSPETSLTIDDNVTDPNVEIFILSYDNNKVLTRPHTDSMLYTNVKSYLEQYKMMTDKIIVKPGFIINFGVVFDVVAHRDANKPEVKLQCIEVIKEYFEIEKTQFTQPLYPSELEYKLMEVIGVRAVNYICITQDNDYRGDVNNQETVFNPSLHTYVVETGQDINQLVEDTTNGQSGYGYKYQFNQAFRPTDGIILPSSTPAVFELKNPNQNIKGVVR